MNSPTRWVLVTSQQCRRSKMRRGRALTVVRGGERARHVIVIITPAGHAIVPRQQVKEPTHGVINRVGAPGPQHGVSS